MAMFHIISREKTLFSCQEDFKDKYLQGFKPVSSKEECLADYGVEGEDATKKYTTYYFDLRDIQTKIKYMMHKFEVCYDAHAIDEDGKVDKDYISYDDMSETDRVFWYPFAYILSCLSGNAFANVDNPDRDLVGQYADDARYIVRSNNLSIKEEFSKNINSLSKEDRQNAFYFNGLATKAMLVCFMKRAIEAYEKDISNEH